MKIISIILALFLIIAIIGMILPSTKNELISELKKAQIKKDEHGRFLISYKYVNLFFPSKIGTMEVSIFYKQDVLENVICTVKIVDTIIYQRDITREVKEIDKSIYLPIELIVQTIPMDIWTILLTEMSYESSGSLPLLSIYLYSFFIRIICL